MSLMLNALKRIEAKQAPVRAQKAAVPAAPSAVSLIEPIELPPALLSDTLPGLPSEGFALETVSLETTMDQLQAYVAEAGLLYDAPLEFDTEEAEVPVIAPVPSDPYALMAQRILRQLPQGRSQVLLFTSPTDGHGKTATLARLTPRLAQGLEGNLLVVDANFRNPDMARWLAVAPTWRLPDILAGSVDWAAAVQVTQHERVSLLSGGPDALDRDPGRTVQGVSQLLRDLTGHYELVLVDAPSLAHRGTVQLAAVCDGTYLVVRMGEGSPRMLCEATQVLQRSGGRLLGCIAIDS